MLFAAKKWVWRNPPFNEFLNRMEKGILDREEGGQR
jgi:hypothetical protein